MRNRGPTFERTSLVHLRDRGCSVGPRGHRNDERRGGLGFALRGKYRRAVKIGAPVGAIAAAEFKHIGARSLGFQNSASSNPAAQDRQTRQIKPFLPLAAVS